MKKKITWILVADGARARVLRSEGWGSGLEPALDKEFVGDRRRTREIGAERPGRTRLSGTGQPTAMEPKADWHRFEKAQFAKSLAQTLDKAALANRFDRLVLCAPPQALGDLRAALGKQARERIVAEVNKDLTPLALGEIEKRMEKVVPV